MTSNETPPPPTSAENAQVQPLPVEGQRQRLPACRECGCPASAHVNDLDGAGPACCACTDPRIEFHMYSPTPSVESEGEAK